MSKVLNISNRLEDKKRKQQLETHQEKMETLQRVVRCSSCHFKCAMCGYHLNTAESPPVQSFFPSKLYLCESCLAEYKEYMEIKSQNLGNNAKWLMENFLSESQADSLESLDLPEIS